MAIILHTPGDTWPVTGAGLWSLGITSGNTRLTLTLSNSCRDTELIGNTGGDVACHQHQGSEDLGCWGLNISHLTQSTFCRNIMEKIRRKLQSLKKLTCCKWRFAVEYSTRIQCSPRSLHSCFLKVCRSCTNDCVGSGLERDGDNGRCSVFCLDRIQVSMVITRGWNSIKGTLARLGGAILSGLPSLRVHNIRSNISLVTSTSTTSWQPLTPAVHLQPSHLVS